MPRQSNGLCVCVHPLPQRTERLFSHDKWHHKLKPLNWLPMSLKGRFYAIQLLFVCKVFLSTTHSSNRKPLERLVGWYLAIGNSRNRFHKIYYQYITSEKTDSNMSGEADIFRFASGINIWHPIFIPKPMEYRKSKYQHIEHIRQCVLFLFHCCNMDTGSICI